MADVIVTTNTPAQIIVSGALTGARGPQGASGNGSGDMVHTNYDPTLRQVDVYSQDNMVDGVTNKNYTATEKTKLATLTPAVPMVTSIKKTGSAALINDVTISPGTSIQITQAGQDISIATDAATTASVTAAIAAQTSVALVKNEVISGTINGVNTIFTLAGSAVTGTVELYKNGVRQNPGSGNDYTVSGSTITMAVAPPVGTVLLADYATSTSQFTSGITGLVTNNAPTGSINGSNTVFTTPSSYVSGTLEVWVNGLKQLPVTHYVETTPASGVFTLSDAPATGDNVIVNYQHTLSAGLGDADKIDGFHASSTPTAGTLLPLDGSGKYPVTTVTGLVTPDASWIAPTLLNSWVYYGAPYSTIVYRKDALGYVHLKGLLKSGTVGANLFVLPVGYRPLEQLIFSTNTNATTASRTDVLGDGSVLAQAGGNLYWSLDGITFKAEQ